MRMVSREILERGDEDRSETKHARYFGGIVIKRDTRDPEVIGQALQQLKVLYPDKSAAERADLLESGVFVPSSNGSK